MKSLKTLRALQPVRLTLCWCDRCSRLVNGNEEEHFHPEQCGGCKRYRRLDSDWGYCSSHESVYAGRPMFEHDTCSKWIEGEW